MADHALPDDLSDWPRDPFRLLGVPHGADAKELRRAYTRLIRLYKPEREPEKFQRIRSAYEALLEGASFDLPFEGPQRSPSGSARSDVDDSPIPLPQEVDEAAAAWESACEGHVAGAYRTLRHLAETGKDSETLFLQLYWIERLHPQLSPGKSPVRWLARGIAKRGLTDRLGQTYLSEVMLNPAEALSERCAKVVEAAGEFYYRLAILHHRWEAAARAGNWQLVQSDLNAQRGRSIDEAAGSMTRLMLTAFDYVGWVDNPEATRFTTALWSNLQQSEDADQNLDGEFSRFELLGEILDTLPRSGEIPSHLVELIREAWISDLDRFRLLLQRQAVVWAGNFEVAIRELDALAARSPAAMVYLAQVATSIGRGTLCDRQTDDPRDQQRIAEQIAMRLAVAKNREPKPRASALPFRLRAELAQTAFDEVLDFDELLTAASSEKTLLPAELAPTLADDAPLRCLIESGRILNTTA